MGWDALSRVWRALALAVTMAIVYLMTVLDRQRPVRPEIYTPDSKWVEICEKCWAGL